MPTACSTTPGSPCGHDNRAIELVPGKLDAWRRFVAAVLGERREAYESAIREGGLTRLRVWHHRGPAGVDTAVVQYDGSAPEGSSKES